MIGRFGGGIGHLGTPHPISERPVQPLRLNLNPERLAGEPSLGAAPKVTAIAIPKIGGVHPLRMRLAKITGARKA